MEESPEGCRYCGRNPLTREHALASQLAALIPSPQSMTSERVTVGAQGAEILSSWSAANAAQVVVREFCEGCNGGWMNDLDTAVKPSFAEMVIGNTVHLERIEARIWATRVVKQFLSYQASYPDDLSSPDEYRLFYSTRKPLDGQQVYLGIGTSLPWVHLHGRRALWATTNGGERKCVLQLWTAVYGQLVVQIVAPQSASLRIPMRAVDGKMSVLWPIADSHVQPGGRGRLSKDEVAELTMLQPLLELS